MRYVGFFTPLPVREYRHFANVKRGRRRCNVAAAREGVVAPTTSRARKDASRRMVRPLAIPDIGSRRTDVAEGEGRCDKTGTSRAGKVAEDCGKSLRCCHGYYRQHPGESPVFGQRWRKRRNEVRVLSVPEILGEGKGSLVILGGGNGALAVPPSPDPHRSMPEPNAAGRIS